MYYLLLPSLAQRSALIEYLKSQGILSVFHYLPLHLSEMGRRFGGQEGDCPVTERVSDLLLRLPFYTDMTEGDQDRVSCRQGVEPHPHTTVRGVAQRQDPGGDRHGAGR
jgi:dTDP-4-amino-4,6-dideoxygalactose transaminase